MPQRSLLAVALSCLILTACKDRNDDRRQSPGGVWPRGWTSACYGRGSATTPPETGPLCHKGEAFACAVEAAILTEVNALRPASAPLAGSGRLSFVAREWSKQQMASRTLSHAGFPDQRMAVLKGEFGADAESCLSAENVAMSSFSTQDPAAVAKMLVRMWNGSSGHRANMVGPHQVIGIGVHVSGTTVYATQIFAQR